MREILIRQTWLMILRVTRLSLEKLICVLVIVRLSSQLALDMLSQFQSEGHIKKKTSRFPFDPHDVIPTSIFGVS